MELYYRLSKEEVLSVFKTSETGLKSADIPGLLAEYGANELKEGKQKTKLSILLAQFTDVMILILIIAAVISFLLGETTDGFVILAIIIANAWMGYAQESKAEESIRALKKMAAQYAIVVRDGKPVKVEASALVPGDLVLLEAGDIVPADARLIETNSLKTEEASLTGESHSIEKITEVIDKQDIVPGDQLNMVFKGTIVSNGSAKAIVTATGMNTELGKIAGMLDVEEQKTPLQLRLAKFSKQLAVVVIIVCLLVFGFGLMRGEPASQMFLTALSLAVAALPEALPAVITIALAYGARRMVKQKALIRRLPAVETLGSVTYICTDKTGTLTQNVMTVEKVKVAEGKEDLFHHAMMLNNEVRFAEDGKLLGDSTETALVNYAIKQGYEKQDADKRFPLVSKLPFDSKRMRMSTLHSHEGHWILLVKGAPVKMVEQLSAKYKEEVPKWLDLNRSWAASGLRVLFFAYKVLDQKPANDDISIESDLEFLGISAMIDPVREEVLDAIEQCKTAGIKTVMITGDQPLTAKAIAHRLHILKEGDDGVTTGNDLEETDEDAFSEKVRDIAVYARVSPEQKMKIVKALQSKGEFVAMTGDGVNDAPSLKQADIGVSMGITGTDVTKQSADMILLDDNFTTIVRAVREGRRIYENIRKFILYVLSCNLGEILTIFFAQLLGYAIPLLPIHILWINLVTDGLPGIALVSEPAEKDIMNHPPRSPKENLFSGGLINRIILSGLVLTVAAIAVLWWSNNQDYDLRTQQTMVFTTLCFVQLGNALSVRSSYQHLISKRLFQNGKMWAAILLTIVLQTLLVYTPPLQRIFKTSPIEWEGMIVILIATLAALLLFELIKFANRRAYFK